MHRHVAPEVAVLDEQLLVVADGREGALVVDEATPVDAHHGFVFRRPSNTIGRVSLARENEAGGSWGQEVNILHVNV